MILNDAKVVFIHPCCTGGNIINHNLKDHHQQDIKDSTCLDNPYFDFDEQVKNYIMARNRLPAHIWRKYFNNLFISNRQDFFYFATVRNPWSQTLSFVKQVIHKLELNISISLEHKHDINEIIKDLYLTHKYRYIIVWLYHHEMLTNQHDDELDYDYIVYFEDIENDLKTLSQLSGLEFNHPLNITNKPIDYREFYTQETLDIVSKAREKDCELFGYDFDKGLVAKSNQPKIKGLIPIQPQTTVTKTKIRMKNNNSGISVTI